jgi:hypothetical protein
MEITIEKVDNGYVATWDWSCDDDGYKEEKKVFTEVKELLKFIEKKLK